MSVSGTSGFKCPDCGGTYWGTSGCLGPREKMRGHCHTIGCKFTWLRIHDAMVGIGVPKPGIAGAQTTPTRQED